MTKERSIKGMGCLALLGFFAALTNSLAFAHAMAADDWRHILHLSLMWVACVVLRHILHCIVKVGG